MANRVIQLAESDLSNARENLARARAAARSTFVDPTKQWGQSGKTLNEIISDYEEWEQQALKALQQAQSLAK